MQIKRVVQIQGVRPGQAQCDRVQHQKGIAGPSGLRMSSKLNALGFVKDAVDEAAFSGSRLTWHTVCGYRLTGLSLTKYAVSGCGFKGIGPAVNGCKSKRSGKFKGSDLVRHNVIVYKIK